MRRAAPAAQAPAAALGDDLVVRFEDEQAIVAMDLGAMLDRLARTLSGGMLRRLEIATALLNRPAVLFLDEPTVGLDPTARRMVWEHLGALREQAGTTILFTTHVMEEA